MGELNSDDHYIYYCGQESLRRNGVAIIVNKRVQNSVRRYNLKNDRMISVHFQGKPFNITVVQIYAPTSNVEKSWSWTVLLWPQDLLELTPPKDILFIIGDWNEKAGSKEIPGVIGKFSLLLLDYAKAFDCMDHNKLWKILKEMGIPDHLTCLLRNLCADQEATVRTGHGTTDWFQIGKGIHQGCILSPSLFNLCAEYTMWNGRLDEAQAGIKIAGRSINTFRYTDDTTLVAKSKDN